MKIETLADAQSVLRELLAVIHEASADCERPYYLAYGTALGSFREERLIPWDTDADVLVPTEHYDALVAALRDCAPERFTVIEGGAPGYEHLFARLCVRGVDHNLLHVDIFRLVGASRRGFARVVEIHVAKLVATAFMLRTAVPSKRYWYDRQKATIARRLRPLLRLVPGAFLMAIHGWLARRPCATRTTLFNVDGSYGAREIVPAEWFEHPATGYIDGAAFRLPTNPEGYLRHTYGDFMTPVPTEVQDRMVAFFNEFYLPRLRQQSTLNL